MLVNHGSTPEVAFGKVLRAIRLERGLSQEALGLEANVQRNFISLMELGHNQPSVTTLFKLANALGVRLSKIVALVEAEIQANTLK